MSRPEQLMALGEMARRLDLFACTWALWLGCADAHEKAFDVSADAGAEDELASTPVPAPRGVDARGSAGEPDEGDPIDGPSVLCMRNVFEPSAQPDDAAPCTYQIDPGVVDPQYLAVVVDDKVRPLNRAEDGFLYGQGGVVRLIGAACAEARDGASVDMHTSCAPIVAPADAEAVAECSTRIFQPNERPADSASRCTYRVEQRREHPNYVRVIIEERGRPLDQPSDGWVYEPGGIVRLVGAACDEALRGTPVRIQSECDGLEFL